MNQNQYQFASRVSRVMAHPHQPGNFTSSLFHRITVLQIKIIEVKFITDVDGTHANWFKILPKDRVVDMTCDK